MSYQSADDINLMIMNICRCCLKSGCYKDIFTEFNQLVEKEIYEVMLKDTFDIKISNNEKITRLICDECITKLRNACGFKRMVLESEEKMLMYIQEMKWKRNMEPKDKDNKETSSEIESVGEKHDFDICHQDDSENATEILENVTKDERISNDIGLTNRINNRARIRNMKSKCKMKNFAEDNLNPSKNISDRRGKAPILRKNSLNLIANSTISVFQWNKSRYRCYFCTEPFNDIKTLKEHTDSEHTLTDIEQKIINQQNRLVKVDISSIKCKMCNEKCFSLDDLQNHLINAHNVEFASPEHLLVPFKIQNGGLSCQICFEKFKLFRLLNMHMNKHYQKHICDKCGAGFSHLVFLNLHKSRLHRPLTCDICKHMFKNKVEKKRHDAKIHNKHTSVNLKRFPCSQCDERFSQERLKIEHLVRAHNLKRPENVCNICSKTFITKGLLNNHIKYSHLKEKVHECDVCLKFFYTRSDLNRHKGSHSGEKKFSCGICNSSYTSKDSLRRHTKTTHT